MNAGGVDKACKSNGPLKLARAEEGSGRRVTNTWVTSPGDGDNPPKGGLISDSLRRNVGVKAQATSGLAHGLSASW